MLNFIVKYVIDNVNEVLFIMTVSFFIKIFTFLSNDDSLDWKNYGVENLINTVVNHKHLGNGSIILCHNGAKYTAQALDSIIKGLKEKGYEIVPISELIYKKNYQMDHEGRPFSVGESVSGEKSDEKKRSESVN